MSLSDLGIQADRGEARWSVWLPFPDPRRAEYISAPIGPGIYELRDKDTGELVLVGCAKNCAQRMSSLLPAPLGAGTRRNSRKRDYVLTHLESIEYRTAGFASRSLARACESTRRSLASYRFPT